MSTSGIPLLRSAFHSARRSTESKAALMSRYATFKGLLNSRWISESKRRARMASTPWRQSHRGCRGHPNILVGGTSTGIFPVILLRTFGYSRPILVALRSLSPKPISFGYKTPPIRFSQAGGESAHKARSPNLELALTPLRRRLICRW